MEDSARMSDPIKEMCPRRRQTEAAVSGKASPHPLVLCCEEAPWGLFSPHGQPGRRAQHCSCCCSSMTEPRAVPMLSRGTQKGVHDADHAALGVPEAGPDISPRPPPTLSIPPLLRRPSLSHHPGCAQPLRTGEPRQSCSPAFPSGLRFLPSPCDSASSRPVSLPHSPLTSAWGSTSKSPSWGRRSHMLYERPQDHRTLGEGWCRAPPLRFGSTGKGGCLHGFLTPGKTDLAEEDEARPAPEEMREPSKRKALPPSAWS